MGINVGLKNDYSYLFSGLGNNSGANLNFLSDYVSIKNGSYAKLMKAYYSESANDTVKSLAKSTTAATLSKEETKAIAKVQSTTDALKESADALLASGKNSLFHQKDITTKDENGVETTRKGYDTEALYSAVNQFVKDYNSVVEAGKDVSIDAINNRVNRLMGYSKANENMLNKIGITIGEDGTLAVDKASFQKADASKIQTLFQGNGSYAYQVSAQASMINYTADSAANKANTYTGSGTYGNNYNSGNLFNSYF